MARVKNSIHNITYAFILQAISTLTNFVIRTIMIRYAGMQAVSLNGLFTEVLSALSLAELGVGSAIIYNLYKPLAEGNQGKVCQLMGLFRKAYYMIAGATFFIGLCLCPWIHYLVNSMDYSVSYIRVVYMLFVADLSMSYLFSYKASLMLADQKNYIHSQINMGVRLVGAVIKVAVLIWTKSFVVYLISSIWITLAGNLILSWRVMRLYPWMTGRHERLPANERREVFSNIKNIFIKSLSGKITNSTSNILISTLVSTMQVGIYSNYSLVMGIFRQAANQVAYGGISASLGNLLVTEEDDKCVLVFNRLNYLFYIIASVSCVCVFCCINPFIAAWLGEEFLMGRWIVFICCLNLYIEITTRPLWSIMEVSGLFKYDKYVAILGSAVNLAIAIVLGLRIGMAGIFLGTFMSYFVQAVLKARLLFCRRLKHTPGRYYTSMMVMSAGMLCQLLAASFLCGRVAVASYILQFIVNGLISASIVIGSIVLCTWRTDQFRYFLGLMKDIIRKETR